MGQLVKDGAYQLCITVTHHAAENRIGEMAQRRVGGNASDCHIETLLSQFRRKAARALLLEVTAVCNTARDGETPMFWLDRKLWCRNNVPDDKRPLDIGVRSIAAIVRK